MRILRRIVSRDDPLRYAWRQFLTEEPLPTDRELLYRITCEIVQEKFLQAIGRKE